MKFHFVSDRQIRSGFPIWEKLTGKTVPSVLRINSAFRFGMVCFMLIWMGFFSEMCAGEPAEVPESAFTETVSSETPLPTFSSEAVSLENRSPEMVSVRSQQMARTGSWGESDVQICAGIIPSQGSGDSPARIGIWKPGRWTPFRVRIAPEGVEGVFRGRIVLELCDSDGVTVSTEQEVCGALPLTKEICGLPGNSTTEYTLKIFEIPNDPIVETGTETAEDPCLSSGTSQPVFQTTRPLDGALAETKGTIWVVGPSDAGLEAGVSQIPSVGDLKPKVIRFASAADLPTSQAAWELADVLVLTTEEDAVLASWHPEEIRRLETWTRRGGVLVLSVGRNAEKWAANKNWEPFFPGRLEKIVPVRETAAMEVFAQSPIPITLLGVSERFRIPVARFTELCSRIQLRAQQFDLPLVLRDSMELGQIHWVTFDLTHPAFMNWEGKGNFISVLLDFPTQSIDAGEKKVRGMELGFDDMAGQMRSALDEFSGIRPTSFGGLALFFFVYLLIIGPGCWLLCRKLPRGGETASWTTFFLTVCLGCVLLWGGTGTRGGVRLNQIQVTDYVQETGSVRQSLWANIWSPDANRLTLELAPTGRKMSTEIQTETQIGWFGLPGNFLGGMNSRISGASLVLSEETGCRICGGKMEDVPFFARSTKSFFAKRWFSIPEENERPKFAELRTFYQTRVLGEIRNPFSVPMEHGLLLFDGWAWEIGRIEPGETFTITETTPYLAASALLLDADFIEDHSIKSSVGIRRKNRPYERTSRDLEYIMRTMLFYEKCGGASYTSLHHSFLGHLDASSLLNCRTAVLYAAVPVSETVSENGSISANGAMSADETVAAEDPRNVFGSPHFAGQSVEGDLFTCLNVRKNTDAQTEDPGASCDSDRNIRLLRVFLPVSEE